MDWRAYLRRRRGRYLGQTLEEFERTIQPLIDQEVAETFKAVVRRKMGALEADAVALIELDRDKLELNGYAIELRDKTASPLRGAI